LIQVVSIFLPGLSLSSLYRSFSLVILRNSDSNLLVVLSNFDLSSLNCRFSLSAAMSSRPAFSTFSLAATFSLSNLSALRLSALATSFCFDNLILG